MILFIASNQVGAGIVPPKTRSLFPLHRCGLGCTQMPLVLRPSLNTMPAPDSCGTAPRKVADLYSSVVPVLPIIGRVQFADFAAPAAVPEMESWDRPTTIVL